MRKLRVLATAAVMALAFAFNAVSPVAASVYTGNLAGRPMDGTAGLDNIGTYKSGQWDGGNDCHGVAYGRVNGALVLFTAHHCTDAAGENTSWPTFHAPDGTVLGTAYTGPGGATNDLSYILLSPGAHPAVLNVLYSNNGSGGFTITRQPSLSCAGTPTAGSAQEAFQTTSLSTYGTNNALITGHATINGACRMLTTIPSHATAYKDSGSPMVIINQTNDNHTVSGVASGRNASNQLYFGSLRDGIAELSAYLGVPVSLCVTASC